MIAKGTYELRNSTRKGKRYMIVDDQYQAIHFGDPNYENFTIHKDKQRKRSYIARHKKGQNWRKSGIDKAGFWARWVLWNKKTLADSVADTEKRFGIEIIDKRT